jgi:hypothetical protein
MASMSLRTRIIIVLYIISFTLSLFAFSYVMSKVSIDIECTSYSQYTSSGSDIYYAQNIRGTGAVFKMNGKGRVSKLFLTKSVDDTRILGISAYDGNVYAVLSGFIEKDDEEDDDALDSTTTYHLVCLDKNLNLELKSPKFTIGEHEIVTGFSAEGTGLFITTVSDDGADIKVYCIDVSNLRDPKEVQSDDIKVESVRSKKASQGRFFSDALYRTGDLYVRTDADAPDGPFRVDSYIASAVSDMKLSVGHLFTLYSTYIIWYIAGLLIWAVILILLIRTFENRNRTFYYIFIAEFVLFLIVAIGTYTVASNYSNAREIEHSRFAVTSLIGLADAAGLHENLNVADSSFYETDRYHEIKDALCEFIKREGNSDIFYDVFVYRLRDGIVYASASGRNLQSLEEIYGQSLSVMENRIYRGDVYTAVDFVVEGQDYRAVAASMERLSPDFILVGIINDTSTDASVFVDNRGVFIAFLLIFAIASALVVLAWWLHMRDLTALEEALSVTALGGEFPERPATIGRDIKDMWDSVAEIDKRIDEIEYTKVRILEAYYRFAPKNVEKVLGKKSIIEVSNGDSAALSGTIGMIGIDMRGGRRLKKLDGIIGSIGSYQKDHESIIIGKAADMSGLQLLFMQGEKKSTEFFVELFNTYVKHGEQDSFSTVLYFDRVKFGVMGSDEESTTYMQSDNQSLIYRISNFITENNLGLVITDTIKDRENVTTPLRFMGYAGYDADGQMVKLYEVLDAHPSRVRAGRMATLDRYNEALRLFYEKDFYIARTRFSELLKETPDDTLIKFYVFESDRYLNESVEGDSHKILSLS